MPSDGNAMKELDAFVEMAPSPQSRPTLTIAPLVPTAQPAANAPELDVQQLRRETPACNELVHFNNAGAALMPRVVVDAVIDHLRHEERLGGYEAEKRAAETLASFYTELAGLLNAGSDHILGSF